MPNPTLDAEQIRKANELLSDIRQKLEGLAGGDASLLFAYRRKVAKELGYDERGKPSHRKKLKLKKRIEQRGLCAECGEPLPDTHVDLDRGDNAPGGYSVANTELIHSECHHKRQQAKRYA